MLGWWIGIVAWGSELDPVWTPGFPHVGWDGQGQLWVGARPAGRAWAFEGWTDVAIHPEHGVVAGLVDGGWVHLDADGEVVRRSTTEDDWPTLDVAWGADGSVVVFTQFPRRVLRFHQRTDPAVGPTFHSFEDLEVVERCSAGPRFVRPLFSMHVDGEDRVWLACRETLYIIDEDEIVATHEGLGPLFPAPEGDRAAVRWKDDVWLVPLDVQSLETQWRRTVPGAARVAWRPDGQQLAVVGGGRVTVLAADTGEEVRAFEAEGSWIGWSPDAERLVVGHDHLATRYDAATGEQLGSDRPVHAAELQAVWPLRDGRGVWTFDASGRQIVWRTDGTTHDLDVVDGDREIPWISGDGSRVAITRDFDTIEVIDVATGATVHERPYFEELPPPARVLELHAPRVPRPMGVAGWCGNVIPQVVPAALSPDGTRLLWMAGEELEERSLRDWNHWTRFRVADVDTGELLLEARIDWLDGQPLGWQGDVPVVLTGSHVFALGEPPRVLADGVLAAHLEPGTGELLIDARVPEGWPLTRNWPWWRRGAGTKLPEVEPQPLPVHLELADGVRAWVHEGRVDFLRDEGG